MIYSLHITKLHIPSEQRNEIIVECVLFTYHFPFPSNNHIMNSNTCIQIATAIFANSPFKEGKLSGFLSLRRYVICSSPRTDNHFFVNYNDPLHTIMHAAIHTQIQTVTARGCFLLYLTVHLGQHSFISQ